MKMIKLTYCKFICYYITEESYQNLVKNIEVIG